MRLRRSLATYKGNGTAQFFECFFRDMPGPITIQLRVTKAAWIGGVWRATRIVGSYVHTTSGGTSGVYRCPASRVTAALTGTRSGL